LHLLKRGVVEDINSKKTISYCMLKEITRVIGKIRVNKAIKYFVKNYFLDFHHLL